jgi:hypothetical protein
VATGILPVETGLNANKVATGILPVETGLNREPGCVASGFRGQDARGHFLSSFYRLAMSQEIPPAAGT